MRFLIPLFLFCSTILNAQDALCSKLVKFEMDSNFHETGVTPIPFKIPIDSRSGFEISIAGDQNSVLFNISIYGSEAIIENRYHILIGTEDNNHLDFRNFCTKCNSSAVLIFNNVTLGVSDENLFYPLENAKLLKLIKIRGIKVLTNKGYLSAVLGKEVKEGILEAMNCIMY